MKNCLSFDNKLGKALKTGKPYKDGWLSPAGEFYSCIEWEYRDAALYIAKEILLAKKFEDAGNLLLKRGWARLCDMQRMLQEPIPRITVHNSRPMTTAQKNTLDKYIKHFKLSQENFWGYEL